MPVLGVNEKLDQVISDDDYPFKFLYVPVDNEDGRYKNSELIETDKLGSTRVLNVNNNIYNVKNIIAKADETTADVVYSIGKEIQSVYGNSTVTEYYDETKVKTVEFDANTSNQSKTLSGEFLDKCGETVKWNGIQEGADNSIDETWKIYYTTIDNQYIDVQNILDSVCLTGEEIFGANIVSNTYDADKLQGCIIFDRPVTKIMHTNEYFSVFGNMYLQGYIYDSNTTTYNSRLSSIKLPESVTYIGYVAFYGCNNLESINIPEAVTFIDTYAFHNCSKLKSIVIPENITTLREGLFYGCSSLTSVKLPSNLQVLNNWVFAECTSLIDINMPDTIVTLGHGDFDHCTSLKTIHLPNKIEYIPEGLFQYCESLENIELPSTVTAIYSSAFYDCISLTELVLNDNIKIIDSYTFAYCQGLESIVLPNSIKQIKDYAFYNCWKLKNAVLNDEVAHIGDYAFAGCNSLCSVKIGTEILNIGRYAFAGCPVLSYIYINKVVAPYIETNTFGENETWVSYDKDGNEITNSTQTTSAIEGSSISYPYPSNTAPDNKDLTGYMYYEKGINSLYIPTDAKGYSGTNWTRYLFNYSCFSTYNPDTGEKVEPYVIKEDITDSYDLDDIFANNLETFTDIKYEVYNCEPSDVFYSINDENVLQIYLNYTGVFKIKATATDDLGNVQSIKTTLNVNNTGNTYTYYMNNTSYDTEVPFYQDKLYITFTATIMVTRTNGHTDIITNEITDKYVNIGYNTSYEDVTKTGTFTWNDKSIDYSIIQSGITKSGNIVIYTTTDNSVLDFGYGCNFDESRIASEGYTYILSLELTTPIANIMVDNIGYAVYNEDVNYLNIYTSSVTYKKFLSDSTKLVSIVIPENIKYIADNTFSDCTHLQTIEFKGITSLSSSILAGCSALRQVKLNDNITNIDSYAFENCSSLENINIPSNLTMLSEGIFQGCNLTSIEIPDNIEYIDCNAFQENLNLTYVKFGANVAEIEAYAFTMCPRLSTLEFTTVEAPIIYSATFGDPNDEIEIHGEYYEGYAGVLTNNDNINIIKVPENAQYYDEGFWASEVLDKSKSGYTITNIEPTNVIIKTYFSDYYNDTIRIKLSDVIEYFGNTKDIKSKTIVLSSDNNKFKYHITNDTIYFDCHDAFYVDINITVTMNDGTTYKKYAQTYIECWDITKIEYELKDIEYKNYLEFWEDTIDYTATGVITYTYGDPNSDYPYTYEETEDISDSIYVGNNSRTVNINRVATITYHSAKERIGYAQGPVYNVDFTDTNRVIKYTTWNNKSSRVELYIKGVSLYNWYNQPYCIYDPSYGGFMYFYKKDYRGYNITAIYLDDDESNNYCADLVSLELPAMDMYTNIYLMPTIKSIKVNPNNLTYTSGIFNNGLYRKDEESNDLYLIQGVPDVSIDPNTKYIKYNAYMGTTIKSIDIPSNITEISSYTFCNCYYLSEINLPDNLSYIDECAFYNCSSLKYIDAKNVYGISYSAFENCTSLTSILLHNNLEYEIYSNCFANCISLKSINIPNNVYSIDSSAFLNCLSLSYVKLPSNLEYINAYAFNGCKSLTALEIPEYTEYIDSSAFLNCDNLSTIIFTSSIDFDAGTGCAPTITGVESLFHSAQQVYVPYECVESYKLIYPSISNIIYPLYTPSAFTNLTLSAYNVDWHEDYTYVSYTLYADVYNYYTKEFIHNYEIKGGYTSETFGENESYIDASIINLECTIEGITANTSIIQGVKNDVSICYSNDERNGNMYTDIITLLYNDISINDIYVSGKGVDEMNYVYACSINADIIKSESYYDEESDNYIVNSSTYEDYTYKGYGYNYINNLPANESYTETKLIDTEFTINGSTRTITYIQGLANDFEETTKYDSNGNRYNIIPLKYKSIDNVTAAQSSVSASQSTVLLNCTMTAQVYKITYVYGYSGYSDILLEIIDDYTLTGTITSPDFGINEDEENDVQKTFQFTVNGFSDGITITQKKKVNMSISVNLNSLWLACSAYSISGYTMYQSFSNYNVSNSYASMKLTFNGNGTYEFYIGSYAESSYDYTIAHTLDNNSYATSSYSYVTTLSYQYTPTALNYMKKVTVTITDNNTHFMWITYLKDGSVNNGNDRGYLAIPTSLIK